MNTASVLALAFEEATWPQTVQKMVDIPSAAVRQLPHQ
jgi:hypothetical protein